MSTRRTAARLVTSTALNRRRLFGVAAGAAGTLAASLAPRSAAAQDAAQDVSPQIVPQEGTAFTGDTTIQPVSVISPGSGSRYFAETGHNLAEPFRSRWEQAGGEAVLGQPL